MAFKLDNKAEYAFYCGLTAYSLFDWDKALKYFTVATSIEEDNSHYRMWQGIVNYDIGELSNAKQIFLYAYTINPESERIRLYLARTLNKLREYQQVIQLYKNGIGMLNLHAREIAELGYAYFKEVDLKQSTVMFKKSIELEENYAEIGRAHV